MVALFHVKTFLKKQKNAFLCISLLIKDIFGDNGHFACPL